MFPKPDSSVFSKSALANTLTVLGIVLKVEFIRDRNNFVLFKMEVLLFYMRLVLYIHSPVSWMALTQIITVTKLQLIMKYDKLLR